MVEKETETDFDVIPTELVNKAESLDQMEVETPNVDVKEHKLCDSEVQTDEAKEVTGNCDNNSELEELQRKLERKESEVSDKVIEVEELQRNLERKESEVLWVKSECDDKIREIESTVKEKEELLFAEIEQLKAHPQGTSSPSKLGESKAKNLSAFLQCGVPNSSLEESEVESASLDADDSYSLKKAEVDSIKSEYESKIKEMEKTIFDKEDHFCREMELLKSRNKKMANELDLMKMQGELAELDGGIDSAGNFEEKNKVIETLESELNKCNLELEKIMAEKVESDINTTSLNDSIARLEYLLKEKESALNEHRQVEDLLNESLELEKKSSEMTKKEKEELKEEFDALKGSFSPKVKKATLQQKLEIECLKSELERTKLKLKDAQESSIKVHQELFVEHEEILECVKSLPSKKRKHLFEDIYHESKKLKEVNESDLLSESIDVGIFQDPKEDLAVATTITETVLNDAEFILEPSLIEDAVVAKDSYSKETLLDQTPNLKTSFPEDFEVPKDSFSTETLLTSTLNLKPSFSEDTEVAKDSYIEETLLTSTPEATKTNLLYASWQNDESDLLETPQPSNFRQPIYQDDDLFDSYA